MRLLPLSAALACSLVPLLAQAQQNWVLPEAPPDLPDVSHVDFSDGTFMAEAQGEYLASIDGRTGWTPVSDYGIANIVAVARHGGVLYIAAYGAGYTSIDPNDPSSLASGIEMYVYAIAAGASRLVWGTSTPAATADPHASMQFIDEPGGPIMVLNMARAMRVIDITSGALVAAAPQYTTAMTAVPGGVAVVMEPMSGGGGLISNAPGSVNTPNIPIVFYPKSIEPDDGQAFPLFAVWGDSDRIDGAAYGNDRFVGVGPAGRVLLAVDMADWGVIDVPSLPALSSVAFGDGRFVATSTAGMVYYTEDGENWTGVQLPTSEDLISVTYGNGQFVVLTADGKLAYALGGLWSSEPEVDAYQVDSPWFGFFWSLPDGQWIYHSDHGWLYTSGQSVDDLYLYDAALGGWAWTSRQFYPWEYSFADGHPGWVYYFQGTTRAFYSFEDKGYFTVPAN